MLFANTHKFIHEARRLPPVIYDLQITYHKDHIHRKIKREQYILSAGQNLITNFYYIHK